jgi:topoisomerase-4 subunit A
MMMAEFELTDRQAEAILNMRLRSLRKLEEMELRKERDRRSTRKRASWSAAREPGPPAHPDEARSRQTARPLRPETDLGRAAP